MIELPNPPKLENSYMVVGLDGVTNAHNGSTYVVLNLIDNFRTRHLGRLYGPDLFTDSAFLISLYFKRLSISTVLFFGKTFNAPRLITCGF